MRINDKILLKLKEAVRSSGSAKAFARICNISPSNISRYLNLETRIISEDNWAKLAPLLQPEEPQWQPEGIRHTAELAEFIEKKLQSSGFTTADIPALLLLDKKIFADIMQNQHPWPPALLAALLDMLNIDRNQLPVSENEKLSLPSSGIFATGAAVMRLLPVCDLKNDSANAISYAAEADNDSERLFIGKIPVPADMRSDTKAFRITDDRMQPQLQKGDVILTINIPLQDLPDGKIVVAALNTPNAANKLICRRFFRKSSTHFVLQSNIQDGETQMDSSGCPPYLRIVKRFTFKGSLPAAGTMSEKNRHFFICNIVFPS